MPKPLLCVESMEALRSIQAENDPDFLRDFFSAFLSQIPERMEGIRLALNLKDARKLANCAHALKSGCLNFSAPPLVILCAQLEECGRANDLERAQATYLELTPLVAQLIIEISALPELKVAA